jgi:hypothetical protein
MFFRTADILRRRGCQYLRLLLPRADSMSFFHLLKSPGATGLFIYSGEVSIPGASSFSGTDFSDTFWIPLEASNVFPDPSSAIIGWGVAPPSSGAPSSLPQPIVLPTSWNNSPTTSESVVAINGPSLAYFSAAPNPMSAPAYLFRP